MGVSETRYDTVRGGRHEQITVIHKGKAEQLLGAVLICSLIGFILSTARVGQECVSSGHDQRTDRIEEVKRYLRQ